MASKKLEERQVELEINMPRIGGKIIEFHNVSKSYPGLNLFESFSYKFRPGEKVGIIGKAYRSQGLGKLMMKFAIEKSIELGFKALQLNLVVVNNHASIKICKDYGFKVIGTLPKAFYYKQREYVDAFVMYKELS